MTKIIGANWKMNFLDKEAQNYVHKLCDKLSTHKINGQVIIFPPNLYISNIISITSKDNLIKIGAQNMYPGLFAPITGEVSPPMLKDLGVEYVLIGHSERKKFLKEKNFFIYKKIKNALENDLKTILCCGESLKERKNSKHFEAIKEQIEYIVKNINHSHLKNLIIAYEPIWAIGTNLIPTSEEIQEIHSYIRDLLMKYLKNETAQEIPILYGGSCNKDNAKKIINLTNVNGLLIGNASLDLDHFYSILLDTVCL